jgi:hypothetical protein
VIAVALDDDQGAYIDNQTWPAPHLQAYLRWLDDQVRSVTGPVVPTFINTYDMKVPASSPFWAMGNWYQSDAYTIGEHDRVELDFATGTLTAQEGVPLATSEFQAGWLASPEDPQPRPAAPENTSLALAELLAWGVHGVVDFPLQDTLAPFGWEAPFSNAFYSWDAAIARDPQSGPLPSRWAPTNNFGETVRRYGPLLAQSHRVARIAIADEVSASDPHTLSNGDVAAIAARLKDDLRVCNLRGLTCDVVDLRLSSDARLRQYATLVVPPFVRPPQAALASRLAALQRADVTIVKRVPNESGPAIVVLAGPNATFGVSANWSSHPRTYRGPVWDGIAMRAVAPFTLAPREARVFPIAGAPPQVNAPAAGNAAPPDLPPAHRINLNATQAVQATWPAVRAGATIAVHSAAFGSGDPTVTLANDRVVAIVSPGGGARLIVFASRGDLPYNAVNATGALRDDVLVQSPPSTTDRIAAYTHSYPAGTFNRAYRVEILSAAGPEAVVRFTYTAPDLPGHPTFEKTLRLAAESTRLVVDERVTFDGPETAQRAVEYTPLAVELGALQELSPTFIAAAAGTRAVAVTWDPSKVDRATWKRYGSNGTLMLVTSAATLRTTYALAHVASPGAARAFAQKERDWLAANPNPP